MGWISCLLLDRDAAHYLSFCSHSEPIPPHLLHPGLQDGRASHPVCAEFYGGVRRVPGAGESWKHPPVYAFYYGEL